MREKFISPQETVHVSTDTILNLPFSKAASRITSLIAAYVRPFCCFGATNAPPFAHPHSAESNLLKQGEAEKVAAYGRLPFKSGAVAPAFQHEVVRRRSLHKAEAKRAVYHVVDYYSEKVEFENFVEHKLADGNLHYLRAAVLLAVRFGRYLYFKFHTYILTQRGAALQEHLKQNGSTGAIFAAYGQKILKWVCTNGKADVIIYTATIK